MDLGMQLILLIIFGIVGFITDKIWGINPYKIFSDISAALLLLSFMFFIFPAMTNPNPDVITKSIESLLTFFVESLPSIIIGDVAGTFVSRITEGW